MKSTDRVCRATSLTLTNPPTTQSSFVENQFISSSVRRSTEPSHTPWTICLILHTNSQSSFGTVVDAEEGNGKGGSLDVQNISDSPAIPVARVVTQIAWQVRLAQIMVLLVACLFLRSYIRL